jgi:hypothetical protein
MSACIRLHQRFLQAGEESRSFSALAGCGFFLGGISPSRTRSKIFCQL